MNNFLNILTHVILPIFIQIGLGYALQKKFKLSIETLAKIQLFVFIPALIFYNIYTSTVNTEVIGQIALFIFLLFIILMAISTLLAKLLKYPKAKSKAFVNSVILGNQGNFCLPIIGLLYNNELVSLAISLQIIVMLIQSIVTNTIGLYNASSGTYSGKEAIINILRVPLLHVTVIILIIKLLNITIWEPILSSAEALGRGFTSVALITLGAQLAETKINLKDYSIYFSNISRLLISPIIGFCLILIMGIDGITAQVLMIGAAAPSAVNSVLLAIEFEGDAEYASQAVFSSTIVSCITMAILINFIMSYF